MKRTGLILAEHLHLRDAPNGRIVGALDRNDIVEVTGEAVHTKTIAWLPVLTKKGERGFVAEHDAEGSKLVAVNLVIPPSLPPACPQPRSEWWQAVPVAAWLIGAAGAIGVLVVWLTGR
jgi:hypothetical protein